MQTARQYDVVRFYSLMAALAERTGGPRRLETCSGRMEWPPRGVYFFMESGETRRESGHDARVVRVGTHALGLTSQTTLWNRLSQHRGQTNSGGGNHRGSIFRHLIGNALLSQAGEDHLTWGVGTSAAPTVRADELTLERRVSAIIRAMPFLWLAIEDAPGPDSLRGYIERNVIALLSNRDKPPIDPPSSTWLGFHCDRPKVRQSGLWNQVYTDSVYDPEVLGCLERLLETMPQTA